METEVPEYIMRSTSWNPWHGCHRVSEGCRNCYMFLGDGRRGISGSDVVRRSSVNFDLPLRRGRNGRYKLRDMLVLTSMTSDFFIEEADAWRDDAWEIIRTRRDLTFEILTKRPERIRRCLPDDWGDGYGNVRLSVSAEDQKAWDQRVPILLDTPSAKRDVFVAPMIGPIDAEPLISGLDCIYLGGEYCGNARSCDYSWVTSVREACERNKVSFFWRNCGQYVVFDGHMVEFSSIRDQGRFCAGKRLDLVFDDPIPHGRQTTLDSL